MITHIVDSDWLIDCLNDKWNSRELIAPLIDEGCVATSVIVLAEIQEGLQGLEDRDRKIATLNDLLDGVPVLGIDESLAPRFAALRYHLRSTGQIINDHDIWIAATALQHDLTLISRDKHFDRIPGLKRHV